MRHKCLLEEFSREAAALMLKHTAAFSRSVFPFFALKTKANAVCLTVEANGIRYLTHLGAALRKNRCVTAFTDKRKRCEERELRPKVDLARDKGFAERMRPNADAP